MQKLDVIFPDGVDVIDKMVFWCGLRGVKTV